jgi:hypothetical protein
MSCICSVKKRKAEAKRVSTLEILARIEEEQETLWRLAYVITGDIGAAERSVGAARELVMNRAYPFPFPGQLTEWVKRVTINAAITNSLHEITRCGSRYVNQNCTHREHLLNGDDSKLREFRNLLMHIDPEIVIAELDSLARAVAILRTSACTSILDCILMLELSLDIVLAANCRAMTWFAEKRSGLGTKAPTPEPKQVKP